MAADSYDEIREAQNTGNKKSLIWHNIIVWVVFTVGALGLAAYGVLYITGLAYPVMSGLPAADVYSNAPSLHIVDIIFGVMLIASAAYGVFFARPRLKKLSFDGPKALYIFILFVGICFMFYKVGVEVVTNITFGTNEGVPFWFGFTCIAVATLACILVHSVYYNNRSKLLND